MSSKVLNVRLSHNINKFANQQIIGERRQTSAISLVNSLNQKTVPKCPSRVNLQTEQKIKIQRDNIE
jgi:hypothetical protein